MKKQKQLLEPQIDLELMITGEAEKIPQTEGTDRNVCEVAPQTATETAKK